MDAAPRPGRPFFRGLVFAACLTFCLAAVGGLAATAFADPYEPPAGLATEPAITGLAACPEAPEGAYEGTDDAANELRLLRGELVGVCEALVQHQVEELHRTWWVVVEALGATEQRATGNTLAQDVKDRLEPPVLVRQVEPVEVEDTASAQYSDEIVTAVDASGGVTKEALWFLIGLTVLGTAGVLYSWLKP